MKIRHLILAATAVLAVAVSCKQEKPVLGVTIDPTSLAFTADGGTFTVQATSSDPWTLSVPAAAQEWLQVSPLSGSGDVTVTVTASANPGKPRAVTVNFTAGLFTEPLSITQDGKQKAGDGLTPETAFSASEANEWVMANISSNNEPSPQVMYVKGFIHKIGQYKGEDQYFSNNSYGNATFYMSDNKEYGADELDFEAYQVYYLGGRKFIKGKDTDIKVGDEVIICGHLTKYNDTAETMGQGDAYLYSLNGKVEEPQTEITDATVADFIKSDGATYYRLTGKVSNFKTGTNSSGKNYMQFNLKDDTGTILVYGFKDGEYDKWANVIEDGGTVVITGTYEFYEAKSQHEVMNTTVESFTPGQTQTEITDCSVADFIKTDGTTYYRLTGKVSNFTTGTNNSGKNYMQFNLTDDTGTILVYGFKNGEYDKWASQIKDYGTVVLTGTYEFYSAKSQHEVMNATIESFKEGETPTEFEQLTVAQFIAKADPSTPYRLAGVVEEFAITNADKGYLSFNLTDDTGSILVYSLVEGQFAQWSDKLENGGNILLVGSYKLYQNTPEVVNATIESFEANPDYKYIKADPKEITVKATATTVSFNLESNSAWTITSDNEAFVPDPASGEGNAAITVNFPANAENTDKVANLTIACGDKTVTVTITQLAANAEPTDTVSAAIKANDDTNVEINEAIVAALSTRGCIVTDGKANVYVYANAAPACKIGDMVSVKGKKTTFYGLPEITEPTVTVVSSGNEVPRTQLVELDGNNIDSYSSSAADYLVVVGKLTKNGNYWRVTPDGAARYASPDYMISDIDPSAFQDQQVKFYGYFNTIHSGNNYVKVIATEFLPADENVKYLTVNPETLSIGAAGGEVSFTVSANQAWTVNTQDQFLDIQPASGEGNGTVKVVVAENPNEAARTGIVVVNGADGKTVEVKIAQSAKAAAGTGSVTWDKTKLAGASDKEAANKMDDVISFTNDSSYSGSVTELRVYKGKNLVITAAAGYKITSITMTCQASGTTKYGPGCWGSGAPSGYSFEDKVGTWSGSSQAVSFNATDNQVRIEELTVTYKAD